MTTVTFQNATAATTLGLVSTTDTSCTLYQVLSPSHFFGPGKNTDRNLSSGTTYAITGSRGAVYGMVTMTGSGLELVPGCAASPVSVTVSGSTVTIADNYNVGWGTLSPASSGVAQFPPYFGGGGVIPPPFHPAQAQQLTASVRRMSRKEIAFIIAAVLLLLAATGLIVWYFK